MATVQERGSTHVYKVNKISKEEIDSMTAMCVYEQPAYCNAACPLKVDVKGMLDEVSKGNMKKALQIYEKSAPFPLLLSKGCSAPCKAKCKLLQLGDAVDIPKIELSVAANSDNIKSGSIFRTKKKKKIAIFGSGLFNIFLAGEVEKKVYPVTVFCNENDKASWLKSAGDILPDSLFESELKRLNAKDIDFVFDYKIDTEKILEARNEFDVICLSKTLFESFFTDGLYDEAILFDNKYSFVLGEGNDVLDGAFKAKRAALTIDRLAQNLSPYNTRGEEGPCDTRLYTSLDGISGSKSVKSCDERGIYSPDEMVEEAGRCIQCHCDECMKSCAYLKHYKKYPGLLSKEIYNNTQIIMGDHQLNKPMNACSLCGQCKVVCPNSFDMAYVCKSARENMVSTDKMPLSPHEFALMDMMFSNSRAFLSKPQLGFNKCKYVFFPGCQAGAIAPDTVKAAYYDLCERLRGGVAIMLGCCGAICDWAGRGEMFEGVKEFISNELARLGDPIIIAGCPSCKKEFEENYDCRCVSILKILEDIGLPANIKSTGTCFAVHDSCGARGDRQTQEAVRNIARDLGCQLVDTEYSYDRSPCCGYGGLAAYANKEVAKEMAEKCLEDSELPYISYCMSCRDRFAREGRESKHILELVYGTDAGASPDISEKRKNRLSLKNDLLSEIWGEKVENIQRPYKLEFTDDALKMMDERMILIDDVYEIMDDYYKNGQAIEDAASGYIMANKREGNVTFWVAFTESGDTYLIHRAYSHRMTVIKRN